MLDIFRKIFRGESQPSTAGAKTAPLSDQQLLNIVDGANPSNDMQQLISATGQSIGRQRDHNEDSVLAFTATIAGKTLNVPFGLYMVADGMGGHQFGEVASDAAIRVIAGRIIRTFHSYLFSIPTQQPEESLQEIMEGAIKDAHHTVQQDAPGSGTTITAALVLGQQVIIGHVGDSRAYAIFPDGRAEQLTHDHSLVKRLEELGHLNKEEAAIFPQRNVLIRALGQGDNLDVDVFTVPFPHDGTLMLCSDGLWGVVTEQDLVRSLQESPTLARACQKMVTAANTAGGPDNISVVLVQLIG